jgi:hypothetical protein
MIALRGRRTQFIGGRREDLRASGMPGMRQKGRIRRRVCANRRRRPWFTLRTRNAPERFAGAQRAAAARAVRDPSR